jgi:hypothetical protein
VKVNLSLGLPVSGALFRQESLALNCFVFGGFRLCDLVDVISLLLVPIPDLALVLIHVLLDLLQLGSKVRVPLIVLLYFNLQLVHHWQLQRLLVRFDQLLRSQLLVVLQVDWCMLLNSTQA